MKAKIMNKISVIIPLYNDYKSIKFLLMMLTKQSLIPDEVIVVDSSDTKKSFNSILNDLNYILVHKKIEKSYPGKARNIGIKASRNELIALLDCRTFPNIDWLKQMFENLNKNKKSIIFGSRKSLSENKFKNLLKNSTYGNEAVTSISGSILLKKDLIKNELYFNEKVRAGEDLLWIDEYKKSNLNIGYLIKSNHIYYGFPNTINSLLKKWFYYSMSNSFIPILKLQKYLYFFVFLLFSLFVIFNFFLTQNNLVNILNSIVQYILLIIIFLHFFYRSLIKPLNLGISLRKILPLYWLQIYFVSLVLDIIKLPGSVFGFFNLIFKFYKKK